MNLVSYLESIVYPVSLVGWAVNTYLILSKTNWGQVKSHFFPKWVHETWALWPRCSAHCQPHCEGETSEATTGPSQPSGGPSLCWGPAIACFRKVWGESKMPAGPLFILNSTKSSFQRNIIKRIKSSISCSWPPASPLWQEMETIS